MPRVYCQLWEESEAGWGVRPDGWSLHLTVEDAAAYVKSYWAEQTKREPHVPHEYSRPCGEPYLANVNNKVYQEVKVRTHGTRDYGRTPPARIDA